MTDRFNYTIKGASHGEQGINVQIEGLPAGEPIDLELINHDLAERRPGQELTTPRKEDDQISRLTGLDNGNKTTGDTITIVVPNTSQRSQDYDHLKGLLRPGHGVTQDLMQNPGADVRGGGSSSARLTIGDVAVGSIARQILMRRTDGHYSVSAGLNSMGEIIPRNPLPTSLFTDENIKSSPVKCPDINLSMAMERYLVWLSDQGNSVGAEITAVARGVPPLLGDRPNNPIDGLIARRVMNINAVKSIEIGDSNVHTRLGSENIDHIIGRDGDRLVTERNIAGGILGGRTTGEEIVLRVGFKPTSTIRAVPMRTVDTDGMPQLLDMSQNPGRHDPCVAIRGTAVVKAALSIGILEALLEQETYS